MPTLKKFEEPDALDKYAVNLLSEFESSGIKLAVIGETGLHITGEVTEPEKEHIRLWKRQLINALSPECECGLRMRLIDQKTWFCPFGCRSFQR